MLSYGARSTAEEIKYYFPYIYLAVLQRCVRRSVTLLFDMLSSDRTLLSLPTKTNHLEINKSISVMIFHCQEEYKARKCTLKILNPNSTSHHIFAVAIKHIILRNYISNSLIN